MDPISDKTRTNLRDTAKQLYAQGVDAVMHIHAETVLQYEVRLEQAEAALEEAQKSGLQAQSVSEIVEVTARIVKKAEERGAGLMRQSLLDWLKEYNMGRVGATAVVIEGFDPAEVCKQAREEKHEKV